MKWKEVKLTQTSYSLEGSYKIPSSSNVEQRSISGVFQEHLDILTLLCAFVMNRLHKLLFIVLACSAQQGKNIL